MNNLTAAIILISITVFALSFSSNSFARSDLRMSQDVVVTSCDYVFEHDIIYKNAYLTAYNKVFKDKYIVEFMQTNRDLKLKSVVCNIIR